MFTWQLGYFSANSQTGNITNMGHTEKKVNLGLISIHIPTILE